MAESIPSVALTTNASSLAPRTTIIASSGTVIDVDNEQQTRRVSGRALGLFRRGVKKNDIHDTISVASDRSDRLSADSRDEYRARGLSYQPRVKSCSTVTNQTTPTSRQDTPVSVSALSAHRNPKSSQNTHSKQASLPQTSQIQHSSFRNQTLVVPLPSSDSIEPTGPSVNTSPRSSFWKRDSIQSSPAPSITYQPRLGPKLNSSHDTVVLNSTSASNNPVITTTRIKTARKKLGAIPVVPIVNHSQVSDTQQQQQHVPVSLSDDPSTPQPSASASPVDSSTSSKTSLQLQRPSLKVRIITWNMHDSLPKGDLEALLGKPGSYLPPQDGWDISDHSETESDSDQPERPSAGKRKAFNPHVVGQESVPRSDRIPPLPHNGLHPYHIIVVAGQECPWGDGKRLATGVGMAGELGGIVKQKNRSNTITREKEKQPKERDKRADKKQDPVAKLATNSDLSNSDSQTQMATSDQPKLVAASESTSFPFHPSPTPPQFAFPARPPLSPFIGGTEMDGLNVSAFDVNTPAQVPGTPGHIALMEGFGERVGSAAAGITGGWGGLGGKGWSDMCEDWFCKGITAANKEKDRNFIPGALLARALSHSPSKKEVATPRLNALRAKSNTSVLDLNTDLSKTPPGTPAFAKPESQLDPSSSSAYARKLPKDLSKLLLRTDDTGNAGRFDAAGQPLSPTQEAIMTPLPRSPTQPNSSADIESFIETFTKDGQPAVIPQTSNGMLAVPLSVPFNRIGSFSNVAKSGSDAMPDAKSAEGVDFRIISRPISPDTMSLANTEHSHNTDVKEPLELPVRLGARLANDGPSESSRLTSSQGGTGHATPIQIIPPPEMSATLQDGTPKSLGPYELVIKERMMGCYMAVYVWKGCKDRIKGASRSHVKSGLLSGRVGNKGGVGISIKLGATRLLFVNAHLAAHEGKVAMRLANVAKIKAALKVDSFLPKGDPRAELEDITEQFDHCFWFGDLNFRIDISRQHADWLLMHKRYDQALAFDQLRKVLREGDAFKGFQEAAISFPPTYKYDVLKAFKPKRSKSVHNKILHRRLGSKHGEAFAPVSENLIAERNTNVEKRQDNVLASDHSTVSASAHQPISRELLLQADSLPSEPQPSAATQTELQRRKTRAERAGITKVETAQEAGVIDFMTLTDDDTASVCSSAWDSVGSTSGFGGQIAASMSDNGGMSRISSDLADEEKEAENRKIVEENTQAAQGAKLFSQGAAIKAKFRILGLVKSAAGYTGPSLDASSADDLSGKGIGRGRKRSSFRVSNKIPAEYSSSQPLDMTAPYSKRFSIDSTNQDASASCSSPVDSTTSGASYFSSAYSFGTPTTEINSISLASDQGSADGAMAYQSSSVGKETLGLGRSVSQTTYASKLSQPDHSIEGDFEFLEAQPYDTSAKQRVPSWCDRVLWRSTVPVEDDSEDEDGGRSTSKCSAHEGLGSRVGNALSNAFIAPLRQAAERRHASRQGSTSSALLAATAATSPPVTFSEAAPASSLVNPTLKDNRRSRAISTPHHPDGATPTRARAPHLLQKFLHPKRRHAPIPKLNMAKDMESKESRNYSQDLTAEQLARAISVVDLPSQLEGRKTQFGNVESNLNFYATRDDQVMQMPRVESAPIVSQAGLYRSLSAAGAARMTETERWATTNLTCNNISADSGVQHALEAHNAESGLGLAITSSPTIPTRDSSSFWRNRGTESIHSETTAVKKGGTIGSRESLENQASSPPLRPASSFLHWPNRSHQPPELIRNLANGDTERQEEEVGYGFQRKTGGSWWIDHLSQHLPYFFTPARDDKADHNQTKGRDDEEAVEVVGPKKGRVECLLYKSLDDREMRILEGRSDHRPVVFVGSIGI